MHCTSGAVNQKRPRTDEECTTRLSKDKKKIRDRDVCGSSSNDDDSYHTGNQQWSQNGDYSFDSMQGGRNSDSDDQTSAETLRDGTIETAKIEAIRRIKLDMEENNFCYIPPRVNIKRLDYLYYVRKKDEGTFTYVAHADYYILLRACAKTAQVEIRCMHIGVLNLERRLAWLEHRINHCLHLTPPIVSCEFCSDRGLGNATDEDGLFGLSNLNI